MIEMIGGPDRDRTDDLFHAMEARSQLRHRPTTAVGQLSYSRRYVLFRQTPKPNRADARSEPSKFGHYVWEHFTLNWCRI